MGKDTLNQPKIPGILGFAYLHPIMNQLWIALIESGKRTDFIS
jgi:hypothetical protein